MSQWTYGRGSGGYYNKELFIGYLLLGIIFPPLWIVALYYLIQWIRKGY